MGRLCARCCFNCALAMPRQWKWAGEPKPRQTPKAPLMPPPPTPCCTSPRHCSRSSGWLGRPSPAATWHAAPCRACSGQVGDRAGGSGGGWAGGRDSSAAQRRAGCPCPAAAPAQAEAVAAAVSLGSPRSAGERLCAGYCRPLLPVSLCPARSAEARVPCCAQRSCQSAGLLAVPLGSPNSHPPAPPELAHPSPTTPPQAAAICHLQGSPGLLLPKMPAEIDPDCWFEPALAPGLGLAELFRD